MSPDPRDASRARVLCGDVREDVTTGFIPLADAITVELNICLRIRLLEPPPLNKLAKYPFRVALFSGILTLVSRCILENAPW